MGVDIQTYRCRIGTFKSLQGLDVKTLKCCGVSNIVGLKIVGSLAFIGILLLIAGVESNPGPITTAKCTCSANQTKIKVSGLPTNVDEDYLENLFENEKKQGGGSVKDIILFPDKGTAIVEFEEKEAVAKVLEKRPIKIKEKIIDTEQYHTPYTVKLKGQPLTWTSVDEPTKCLETTCGEVSCITFSLVESGTMFVTFKDEKVAKELVLKGELRVKQAIFTAALHNYAAFEGRGEERIDNETTEHDEDKLSHYEQFLNALGLLDYYPNKISISSVMTINLDNGSMFDQDQKKIELTELPWILLRSLLGVYCKARDRVPSLIKENATPQEQCTSDWLFADSYDHTEVNPLDLFITVYKCCDPMLKQLLFQKCYSCKIAVPFIHVLHDFSSLSSRSVVSIWPLRSLLIQNRYTNNEAKTNLCVEEGVHEHPTNLITFARIGKSANSKSEMLNGLLSDNNCKTFFDKNCVSQIASHKYSEELVEIFWLPVEGNSMDRFNKPVTFLNCRGSLHQFQTEILEFVSKLTDILVILLDIESLNNSTKYTEDCVSKFSSMIIIVDNPMRRKFKPIMDTFRLKLQAQGKFCELISTYQGERKRNPVEMTEILQWQLQNLLTKLQPLSLDTRITSCSQNIYLDEDSDSCKDGKKRARDIIEEMTKAGSSLEWKRVITPVQTTISNEIAKYIKKQQRLQYATEIRDNEEKLHSLRHSCLDNATSTVKQFAFYLCDTNTYDLSLQYFLGWLNIMLGNIKMSTVQKLQKQCNLDIDILKSSGLSAIDIKKKTDLLLKATEKEIDSSSFSIEHLFREISHIYNVLLILKRQSGLPSVEKMKTTLAELIYIGYTFELVDGDNFFLATHWVEAVFLSLSLKIDHESVLTLSVVGLQSSGKSTLLNTMFGSHFAVSSGRCTKGLNLQLIPISKRITKQNKFSYVLVVDTEGLRSTEFSDCKLTHDNELATFISGLGDVTILNVMGENICEINDILNVTVHAFIRLKKANKSLDIRKLCYFIHQNVSDILAARNTRPGLRKLLQKLNDATKDAAQVENVPAISQFNEIMEFDMDSQVFLMPTLWQGSSPMTFVNCDYSQHINFVKNKVLQGACEMKKKSYKSLKDFVIHMKNLWTGVLSEDFVFKYRNSLEIKAYYDLNKYFKRAYFKKEGKIYDDCCENAKESFSRSVDINQLDTDFKKSNLKTDATINNEEVNWKRELEDFLSKSKYSEEQEQWKDTTVARIKTLFVELKSNIILEISDLYEERAAEILTMNILSQDDFLKRLWNLAKKLKENSPPEMMNNHFERIWTDIASQSLIRSSGGASRSIDIKKIIYNYLNKLFDQDKPLLKKFLDKRDVKTVIITLKGSSEHLCIDQSDFTRLSKRRFLFGMNFSRNDVIDIKESIEKSIFKRIDYYFLILKQKRVKKITGSVVTNFFKEVEIYYTEFEKQHAMEFSFDIKLKMKIFTRIAECAGNIFEMHNINYEKVNSPGARLQNNKQKFKTIFISFHLNLKADKTAASELSNAVKSSVRESVIKLLSREIKVALRSHIGSVKYHLISDLLTDLLSMNNYKLFSEYNQNPKLFAAQWITKRSNAFLFDQPSRKYCKMACRHIMEYFEKVKKSVVTTAETFSKNRKTIKNSSASDYWIDTLSSNLKICTLSESQFDLFKNILRNNDNLENFEELVFGKLDESEHNLIEEFENVDSTTVIWNISDRLDPITEVIKETWGCPEECPFCGEPCARDIHDAEKMPHFCIQHKPKGCKGVHFTDSKELSIDTCNFAINSTCLTHTCGVFDYACASGTEKKSCPVGVHRYRDYKMFIKDWDIEPNTDMNAVCKFWMLYLSRFAKEISRDTGIDISNIPSSWHEISDEDAIKSLRELYD